VNHEVELFLGRSFTKIVDAVAYEYIEKDNVVIVIVAAGDHTDEVYEEMLRIEQEAMDRFCDFSFDFHVWSHQGRGSSSVIPKRYKLVYPPPFKEGS